MKFASLFSAALIASSLIACAGAADDSDTQDVSSEALNGTVTSASADWRYVDMIGHSVEVDQRVTGHVSVQFVGGALPLATGQSTLQTANVTLDMPAFDDPNSLVTRKFLVHFETFDGGDTYSAESNWGAQGAIIDASLVNATSRFAATYDTTTQKTRPDTAYASPVTSVSLSLAKQSTGTFKLTARVSGYEERDFARHSTSITLE